MHSGCGSFAVPCSRHANATSSLFGGFLARVLLTVVRALSRKACVAEFVANDTSTETRRIWIWESRRHEGLRVVGYIVRSGPSVGSRYVQYTIVARENHSLSSFGGGRCVGQPPANFLSSPEIDSTTQHFAERCCMFTLRS
eukprot:3530324-Amphidinium_carterae.1